MSSDCPQRTTTKERLGSKLPVTETILPCRRKRGTNQSIQNLIAKPTEATKFITTQSGNTMYSTSGPNVPGLNRIHVTVKSVGSSVLPLKEQRCYPLARRILTVAYGVPSQSIRKAEWSVSGICSGLRICRGFSVLLHSIRRRMRELSVRRRSRRFLTISGL